ncbi:MAG: protein-glutamate O-methyltransferase CheR [Bacillota bacterium]|nr:protein-glutamate O-methyltransferase CheR [Bacillota bacterium]MDW7682978.1 protein-glutamate O-methyltransferase CheR [Bacillota bacterium]
MAMAMDYENFKRKIKEKVGLDLSSYKEQQMRRRIHQLMQRYEAVDYISFLAMLDRDHAILNHFTDYLTINTSQFFRDPAIYRALETVVLPERLQQREPVKIWSAGCSIGAEPYSMAILMMELAPAGNWQIQATDFDSNILAKAKEGKYADNILSNMPEKFRKRYFTERDGYLFLDEQVKSLVRFRRHNLLTDRFETACDVILCRNVFIYFTVETQDALIQRFVQGLKTDGWFIIGCSEMIPNPARFGLQKIQPAIYRKVK